MRVALFFLMGAAGICSSVEADCWPPLNGTSQIVEAPVHVGPYTFGSGSYSFFVGRYSVPSLHCEEAINTGPREWYLMVESGRVRVSGEPAGTQRGVLPPPAPTLPPLGILPPMQAPNAPLLPQLTTLPALQQMPAINNLPQVNDLPPLR